MIPRKQFKKHNYNKNIFSIKPIILYILKYQDLVMSEKLISISKENHKALNKLKYELDLPTIDAVVTRILSRQTRQDDDNENGLQSNI